MPTTTITKSVWTDDDGREREQYRTTVPKALVESFDLEGAEVEWEVESKNALTVRKTDG